MSSGSDFTITLNRPQDVWASLKARQALMPLSAGWQEEQDQQDGPSQQDAGVEMQDDFEGAMEDVPEQPEDLDSPPEAEDERLDQAMEDVGEQVRLGPARGTENLKAWSG